MIKDIIRENKSILPNNKEIRILKEHFPSCFDSEGKFDLERFKETLGDNIDIKNDGYELKFLGKNYARLLASVDTTTVIIPDEKHNDKPENKNSQNIYISGDNLDGLKHLLKSYGGKVKCIYIDPPYNTGSDGFVYNDNFNFSSDELSVKLSITEEQAKRILAFTNKDSASHSAWLMFMYPRLLLARDLLTQDGVIFISIDDNEQANLKLICDDVFGAENFCAQLVWEKKKKGSYLAKDITNIKEYVLVYAKRKIEFSGLIGQINREEETYPCINASNNRELRHIPAGIKSLFKEKDFIMKKGDVISDTTMNLVLHSDLVIKNGVLAKELIIEGNWRYGQDNMEEYAKAGELYITRDLYLRRIVKNPRYKGLKDLLLRLGDEDEAVQDYNFDFENLHVTGWGSNEDADDEQRILLGEQSLMSYPKPVLLIMKLLCALQEKEFTVCDFFSGSATTAEAAMRLNSTDKNVNYIVIQIPEDIEKKISITTGQDKEKAKQLFSFLKRQKHPTTLDYLGIERITRAAKIIKTEHPNINSDLGFKHYTLTEPSSTTLDKLQCFSPEDGLIISNTILNDFGVPTILTTWLVRDGYGFCDAEQITFADYKAYYKEKHLYLINKELSDKAIAAISDKYENDNSFNPENIILFGYSFLWTEIESLKANLSRIKDTERNIKINFDIRY